MDDHDMIGQVGLSVNSFAAWVYRNLGLACPAVSDEELCTPADWWDFNNSLPPG